MAQLMNNSEFDGNETIYDVVRDMYPGYQRLCVAYGYDYRGYTMWYDAELPTPDGKVRIPQFGKDPVTKDTGLWRITDFNGHHIELSVPRIVGGGRPVTPILEYNEFDPNEYFHGNFDFTCHEFNFHLEWHDDLKKEKRNKGKLVVQIPQFVYDTELAVLEENIRADIHQPHDEYDKTLHDSVVNELVMIADQMSYDSDFKTDWGHQHEALKITAPDSMEGQWLQEDSISAQMIDMQWKLDRPQWCEHCNTMHTAHSGWAMVGNLCEDCYRESK